MLEKMLWIGLGGFLGANLRFLAGTWVDSRWGTLGFPLGTLLVNIAGCFLLGFALTVLDNRVIGQPNLRFLVTVGFLGSFTTFSTFSYEGYRLLQSGSWLLAGLDLIGSVVLGVVAVAVGSAAARTVFP